MNNFHNDTDALLTGMVIGHLILNGVNAMPTADGDGNYLPEILVELPPSVGTDKPVNVYLRVSSVEITDASS